jgi:molecular chaperone GrpE (heat shock protein)
MMWLPKLPLRAWWSSIVEVHIAETTDPLELALRQITWNIEDFKDQVASALLPAVEQMARAMEQFLKNYGITLDGGDS